MKRTLLIMTALVSAGAASAFAGDLDATLTVGAMSESIE